MTHQTPWRLASRSIVLMLVMGSLPFTAGRARAGEPVAANWVGARVRVSAASVGLFSSKGTVESVRPDTLVLRLDTASRPWNVRLGSISQLEVSRGKSRHPWTGLGIGLLLGAVAGGAIGQASAADDPYFGGLHVAAGIIGGGLAGAVLGGCVGSMIRTERWDAVHEIGAMRLGLRRSAAGDPYAALCVGYW